MELLTLNDFVDFIKKKDDEREFCDCCQKNSYLESIYNYNDFLKKPLQIWMFCACDEYDQVLEEIPRKEKYLHSEVLGEYLNPLFVKYQKGLESILFKGFNNINGLIRAHKIINSYLTIEDLANNKSELPDLELTESVTNNF